MSHLWEKYIRTCRKRNARSSGRGRQRRQHSGSARCWPQPVQHQPGDQAQHMVPVQRERVVPPVPAERLKAAIPPQSPPAQRKADRRRSKPRKPYRLSHDRLWARWRMAGRAGRRSHQRQARLWPTMRSCACPGDHLPMGLLQQAASGTLGAVPAAGHRRAAGTAAGGRRASRSPAEYPSPNARRRPTGARSAIGRPTASSEWDATCTPRWRGGPGSSWPASFRTRPPARASGRSWTCSRRCRPARAQRHARQRHRVRPPRKAARRAGHGHVLRRPVLQLAAGKQREPQRHDPPVSAQTLRDPDGHGKGGQGDRRRINNRPMRVLGYRTPAEAFADELLELQDQQGCCTSK